MRFCEVNNCENSVFGTDRNTNIGYCNRHQNLRTDLDKRSILQKAIAKHKENLKNNPSPKQQAYKELKPKEKRKASGRVKQSIRNLANKPENVELINRTMGKSELMKEADRVYSLHLRRAAQDKEGFVTCPLCHKRYHIEEKNWDKDLVIQCLHFIPRGVYSLRYSESNTIAGCCYCNKNMNDYPTGTAHAAYRKILVDLLGETEVALMELEHRKINKIDSQMLKNVIEFYTNNQ